MTHQFCDGLGSFAFHLEETMIRSPLFIWMKSMPLLGSLADSGPWFWVTEKSSEP